MYKLEIDYYLSFLNFLLLCDHMDFAEYGLANDASLCQGLGKLLWPELASIYIDSILKNLQNKDEQNHLAFEEACRKAEILEDEVEELGSVF